MTKTLKLTLTLFPALFLLFFWIGVTGNLTLQIWQAVAWPGALALVASFCVARFAQVLSSE
jgi:hypothetical protein